MIKFSLDSVALFLYIYWILGSGTKIELSMPLSNPNKQPVSFMLCSEGKWVDYVKKKKERKVPHRIWCLAEWVQRNGYD